MDWQLHNAQAELLRRRQQDGVVTRRLPDDDGWLQSLREQGPFKAAVSEGTSSLSPLCAGEASYNPDTGLQAVRRGCDAQYRVWLLARLLDTDGRGWLPLPYLYDLLCGGDLHLFEPPRLRTILRAGNGRFWILDNNKECLWLVNGYKLAALLGVEHFTRATAVMPLAVLVDGVARFRAEIFAGWLTGRKEKNPISQACIQVLTGISPRTQRRYCALAGVECHYNIAIGTAYEETAVQEAAWQHGNVFQFVDARGKQGKAGRSYVAWHLPKSYSRRRSATIRPSKKRRMNQTLNGLTQSEASGNGVSPSRRYFYHGKKLAKSLAQGEELYFYGGRATTGTGIWSAITLA